MAKRNSSAVNVNNFSTRSKVQYIILGFVRNDIDGYVIPVFHSDKGEKK